MIKKISYISVALWLCVGSMLPAQSRFLVSQYMYNGLVLNPAYAGSQQQFSLAALYRQQWVGIRGAPTFQMLSAHTPAASNRIGLGLLASAEQVGVHQELSAFVMFAYKLKLNTGYLSMGISGGVASRKSDYTMLSMTNAADPYLMGKQQSRMPNFGLGVYYYNSRMYAGFSIPYLLNKARISSSDAQIRSILKDVRSYYLTMGFLLGRNDMLQFNPSFLIRARDRTPLAADINMNVIFAKYLLVGTSYRVGAGFVLLSQLILNQNFRVMYSYDFTTSKNFSQRASGTHEIMLNYRILIRALTHDPQCSAYF